MKQFHYKYIILGGGLGEYYEYAYRQVNDLEGNLYEGAFPWNKLVELLNRVHFSVKINKVISLPFKKIWVYAYLKHIQKKVEIVAEQNDKICFVFFRTWFFAGLFQHDLETLLRKKYQNCKIVFYIQDQVRVSGIPLEILKDHADLMIYYDKVDAEKWGGLQYDVPYSEIMEFSATSEEVCSDVYFAGYAKDRYEDILRVYEALTTKGIVCDFNIIGVPKEKRMYEDHINYDRILTYKENLIKAGKSRCILEIIQKESVGNTLRVYEAIMLNKLLLSNNESLKKSSIYSEKYMQVYENPESIDIEFIRNMQDVVYINKSILYPVNFLNFVDRYLSED